MTKTNKMACAPSEDSDQLGHPPSLIRVFTVRMKKPWVLSYPLSAQWRLWSDWVDAQADLSFRWAHSHFVGFVMRRLTCIILFSEYFMRTRFTYVITVTCTFPIPGSSQHSEFLFYTVNRGTLHSDDLEHISLCRARRDERYAGYPPTERNIDGGQS